MTDSAKRRIIFMMNINKRENFKELRLWITNVVFPIVGVGMFLSYTHPEETQKIKNKFKRNKES